uniref:MarR family winged helix-turn-helix transcriptional regulator n=1 Tax=Rhodococcus qingshengii TaxID=334542 RepID=UPI002119B85C|nr:MarR family transcriptional regulator [Rhodococcus qingshengii]
MTISAGIVADASLGGALNSLGRALSRRVDDVVDGCGLSADHWYALEVIVRNDGIAMTELARQLSIPAPTVTKFVDRLVSEALVFRLADHLDRRRILVHTSRRGDDIYRQLLPEVLRVEHEFRSNLTDADASTLRAILSTTRQDTD